MSLKFTGRMFCYILITRSSVRFSKTCSQNQASLCGLPTDSHLQNHYLHTEDQFEVLQMICGINKTYTNWDCRENVLKRLTLNCKDGR